MPWLHIDTVNAHAHTHARMYAHRVYIAHLLILVVECLPASTKDPADVL